MSPENARNGLGGAKEEVKRDGVLGSRKQVDHWLGSLFLRMLIPLVPLLLEFTMTDEVTARSMTLAAAMYSISIGVSSMSIGLFTATYAVGIFFIALFGVIVGQQSVLPGSSPPPRFWGIALVALTGVFLAHAVERWVRHVWDCELCVAWME